MMLVTGLVLMAITALGTYFYVHSKAAMENELRAQLQTAAAIAALQIDARDVEAVRAKADMEKAEYQRLVGRLHAIRDTSPNVRFAYLMRHTDDPMVLAFVADADAMSSLEELDRNNNGSVDEDEEPAYPGDAYDATDIPALRTDAFNGPAADPQITVDQWGTLVSGYAPIRDAQGKAIAVIGIDMRADDFATLSQSIFSPVALLLVLLVGFFIAAYVGRIFYIRRLQTLQQVGEERFAFIDLISHQLGAPLATFRWWLELLKEEHKEMFEGNNEAMRQMEEAVDRLASIINEMRAASSRASLSATKEPVDIGLIMQGQQEAVSEELHTRNQALVVELDENIPRIKMDAKLLNGVLDELLHNAMAYSPDGTVINVHVRRKRGGIHVDVQDHGIGIPKEDLPHIFERFRRGSNAAAKKPVGNGLGLAIMKNIVEQAGGTISLHSKEGVGTNVSVWLPVA